MLGLAGRLGEQQLIETPDPVIGWRRTLDSQVATVLVNFNDEKTMIE